MEKGEVPPPSITTSILVSLAPILHICNECVRTQDAAQSLFWEQILEGLNKANIHLTAGFLEVKKKKATYPYL